MSFKGGRVAGFRVSEDCVYGGWLATPETERTETSDGEGPWVAGVWFLYWVCFWFNQSDHSVSDL